MNIYQQMSTTKVPKSSVTYVCEQCDYTTCRKSQYNRHLSTEKHKTNCFSTNSNNLVLKSSKPLICTNCNKCYKERTGLWYHQQKCYPPIVANTDASNNFVIDKELVMSILKQNSDIIKENSELKNMMMNTQNQMMEVIKTGTHNTNTTNNAMNIMDFVDSLKLQLNDLERMGEIGFVNGMSNIIIKNLQDMDVTERPVHCTDQKREVIYVKDEGKWDKEEETKPKLRKAIKHIAHKNAKLIGEFKVKHPDYKTCASKISSQYNTMVIEAMGGIGCIDSTNENKIIKRISKEIMVEKEAP